MMEIQNLIVSYKSKGKLRFFLNHSTYKEEDKAVIAALKNDVDRRIILEILKGQCNTNGTLAGKMGVSASTISWHIGHLREQGIVKAEAEGRYITYSIDSDYLNSIWCYVGNVNS